MGKDNETQEESRLGLRDLETLNKAMVLKNIWRMVSDGEALWAKIMQAKYFPQTSFWSARQRSACT